jgi:menaquinone-dependent protoporphyrinogen IX oxidase
MGTGKSVLIAYGTRYGSAEVVAGELSAYLNEKGHSVRTINLRQETKIPDLNGFDLVVVGSSVAMFSWLGRAKRFLRKAAVKSRLYSVYICCGTAIEEREKGRAKFLDKVILRLPAEPAFSDVLEPVIDFRPGQGIDPSLKKRISGTIKAMGKDRYQPDGLMDFRNEAHFREFLEKTARLVD